MKKLAPLFLIIFGLFISQTQAQEDDSNAGWVILYNEAQMEWHNLFPSLVQNLKKLTDGGRAQTHCTAIAPSGGWMTVYHSGQQKEYASYNKSWADLRELAGYVQKLCDTKEYIKRISFTHLMGWVVLYNDHQAIWMNIPSKLQAAIIDAHNNKELINDVAFDRDGNWLMLSGTNRITADGIDQNLLDRLNELREKDAKLKQVCFTMDGGWAVLYDEDKVIWNNLPKGLEKRLAELHGAGREFQELRIWTLPEMPLDPVLNNEPIQNPNPNGTLLNEPPIDGF